MYAPSVGSDVLREIEPDGGERDRIDTGAGTMLCAVQRVEGGSEQARRGGKGRRMETELREEGKDGCRVADKRKPKGTCGRVQRTVNSRH